MLNLDPNCQHEFVTAMLPPRGFIDRDANQWNLEDCKLIVCIKCQAGGEKDTQYTRIVVPMTFYSGIQRVDFKTYSWRERLEMWWDNLRAKYVAWWYIDYELDDEDDD